MKTLNVKSVRSYDIHIERGLISRCGEIIKPLARGGKAMIISDTNVFPIYGEVVSNSLRSCGFEVYSHIFSAGEASKSLSTIAQMYDSLADNGFSRKDFIVALGGGVTGDMAGFAAATYQRGIDFVQIPTSLLSQVDSSVGSKTGVDIKQGKNLVGAFWQPSVVIIDPNTLNTLTPEFFADGMAEVIKYGCIKSLPLFERLEKENAADIIEEIIFDCVSIKRDVVERDEHEAGERMLLNFGHTLGHSIEKAYGYTGITHGEAVGIGMTIITKASEKSGITESGATQRIKALLEKYSLPTSDKTPLDVIASGALGDKKASGNSINVVLLNKIGDSFTKKLKKSELFDFISQGAKK
ncbi:MULTISPECIES: 3-dehydroquinate synthase [unclassified Ruminococcus]|uniref:3-dehydroquinate synthase n=1 Tax=unclassified Ruminococcus TaxID=2608920 RepID=UPI00210BE9DE|nr:MULTISPECIES: 3-dehydroquinate synthase [unclassified Ruminococcus]MCQ4021563.1 3-dehydroquinate synthase [Ruminococcus sp. zg-924]MCQ4114008.1 3-dehydroquinate synthase [Ruminococcus sp. zg-921]